MNYHNNIPMTFLIGISIFILLTNCAEAATLTVDPTPGIGDYITIQAAVNAATAGDTIRVSSGTYYENVDVNKALTLQGVDSGSGLPVVDAGNLSCAIILHANGCTLQGFVAMNSSSGYSGIRVYSSYNTISGNTATDNSGSGIGLMSASNNAVSDNNATGNTQFGIHLSSSIDNTISGNTATGNSAHGISLDFSSNGNTISGNTATGNSVSGINLYSYSNSNALFGNTATGNSIGIYLSSSSNSNTISDNTATDNFYGIYLSSSSGNNTLSGNTATDNFYGIYLSSSSGNTLSGNTATGNSGYGIIIASSSGNSINSNTATGNTNYGIYLHASSNSNTISGNMATGNSQSGIYLDSSSNNTISGNTANSNSNHGICLDSASDNIISGNTVTESNPNGIYLTRSIDNTISGNILTGNGRGIRTSSSHSNAISGNTITDSSYDGIYLVGSNSNNLSGNNATGNSRHGICLLSLTGCIVSGNTVGSNKEDGIRLDSTSSSTLSGNNANFNAKYGIQLKGSNGNTISSNTASGNSLYGIYLDSSSSNTIYLNTFDNTKNAWSNGANHWNATSSQSYEQGSRNLTGLLGNIWSDYEGFDCDGDGVGETPYDISGGSEKDYHPLGGREAAPSMEADKLADKTQAEVGEWISYTVFVNNTGNINLTNVRAWDNLTGAVWELGTLEPGENYTNTTSYLVKLTDFPGPLVNELRANGTSESCGGEVNDSAIETVMVKYNCTYGPRTHTVCASGCDYTTIQAAINDACPGDTILVQSGTYSERVVVNKTLTLQGVGSPVVDSGGLGNAFTLSAPNCTLQGFVARNSGFNYAGIVAVSSGNTITGNTASGSRYGIHLASSSGNTITGNTASGNIVNGIDLYQSTGNNISGNTVTSNSNRGIVIYFSNGNTISGNTASGNPDSGIFLQSASSNIVTNNRATGSNYGIKLFSGGSSNSVLRNTVTGNNYGIWLESAGSSNTISGNTATGNIQYGIYLVSSSGNTICLNTFDNAKNAWSNGANHWNATTTQTYEQGSRNLTGLLGNIWSDYEGFDCDGDGVGDAPYNISGGSGKDYHPLGGSEAGAALEVEKIADQSVVGISERINYTIWVNNTGNVTLNGVRAWDNLTSAVWLVGTLLPGQNYTNTTRYQVIASDLPGPLVNQLRANGTDPCGSEVNNSTIETVEIQYNCIDGYKQDTLGNGLPDWTVFVDEDGDGILDPGESSNVTDSSGYWQICGLAAGSVVNVTEIPQTGWRASQPSAGWQRVTVQPNNMTDYINFTNQNVTCIQGYKLDDSGEPLEGWTIFIDGNINGALDAGETGDITDSSGFWQICGLDAGSEANVTELAQSGWRPSIPPTGWQTITILANNSTADVNFTNQNVTCTGGEEFSGEIQVEKLADRSEAEVGDWINYTIWVNNTGNVTLTGVRAEDNLTMNVWEVGTLNPSQDYTNTTRYQVKETDLPGPLVNELWANGTNPCGFEVNDSAMETVKVKYNCTYGPRTHTVCASGCDYTTIQAAINAACPGDTIQVHSGTYYEHVVVNKTLILQGVDSGSGLPVVNAGGSGSAITLSANNCTLEGFVAKRAGNWPDSGIKVTSSSNTISGNTATDNGYSGILLDSSSGNTISGNAASGNLIGIHLVSSSSNIISGNTATVNTAYGIYLYSSSNNTILGNTASSNNELGINLYSSNNNTILGNTATGNKIGICLSSSSTNIISGNTATGNTAYGISLYDSSNNNTILGNTATGNTYFGILLVSSSNSNTINGNTANSNSQGGIYLLFSSNGNIISGNTATGNTENGIRLYSSNSNTIYLNTFDNANNAWSNGANHWNATSSQTYELGGRNLTGLLGNIWSDYNGVDCDGDGVGDTPYNISSGSEKDYHPLGGSEAGAMLEVEKIADRSEAEVGDWINYTIWVNNTGNVSLNGVRAEDNLTGSVWTVGTLAPGQNYTNITRYQVNLSDLPGPLANELRANGTDPCGSEVNDSAIETVQIGCNSSIDITKVANTTGPLSPGDWFLWTITVCNTGNISLHDVWVTDNNMGSGGSTSNDFGDLNASECKSEAVYRMVTEQDCCNGSLNSSATVTANDTCGNTVSAGPVWSNVTTEHNSWINVTKTANTAGPVSAGDQIIYTINVRNTGHITLSNVTAEDNLTKDVWRVGTLKPGQSYTNTTSYIVQDTDLPGPLTNELWANGTDPCGSEVNAYSIESVEIINTCIDGYKLDSFGNKLPGWMIFIDNNDDGRPNADEPNSTTDASGHWQICGLRPGNYMVVEEERSGWTNVTPRSIDISLDLENETGLNFTNKLASCPEAINDSAVIVEGSPITIRVLSNDINSTDAVICAIGTPGNGTAAQNGTSIIYTPNSGFCGPDSFNYSICKGNSHCNASVATVYVDVACAPCPQAVNDSAVTREGRPITLAVLSNDINSKGAEICALESPRNGTAVQNGTSIIYTPDSGFCGPDSFNYSICKENSHCNPSIATVYVDVACAPCPKAVNDSAVTMKEDPVAIEVLSNDINATDAEICALETPRNGTAVQSGMRIIYTPDSGFCGPDSFNYSICKENTHCNSSVATVYVDVVCKLCIAGRKINDCTEEGISGWKIFLFDAAGKKIGEDITDPNGRYSFCDLTPGIYYVCEEEKEGWTILPHKSKDVSPSMTPETCGMPWCNDNCVCVNLNLECAEVDFRNIPESLCINGSKINNCTRAGIEKWGIYLYDSTGKQIAATQTDRSGHYSFCGLPPGEYRVCEEIRDGYTPVTHISHSGASCLPESCTCDACDNCIPVILDCDNSEENDFENIPPTSIKGKVIDDCTGLGLKGWTVELRDDQGNQLTTRTTGEDGSYTFTSSTTDGLKLAAGRLYWVCEAVKDGYTPVTYHANNSSRSMSQEHCVPVFLDCGETEVEDLENIPPLLISGHEFNQCTGEGLDGWIVHLKDGAGNILETATTDDAGYYEFRGLEPGWYTVCEDSIPDGWTSFRDDPSPSMAQPGTSAAPADCETPKCIVVNLDYCEDATDNDFYNIPTFCIKGNVNSTTDGALPANFQVKIENSDGTQIESVPAEVNGDYSLCDLKAGTYTVCVNTLGWTADEPCVVVYLDCMDEEHNFDVYMGRNPMVPGIAQPAISLDDSRGAVVPGAMSDEPSAAEKDTRSDEPPAARPSTNPEII